MPAVVDGQLWYVANGGGTPIPGDGHVDSNGLNEVTTQSYPAIPNNALNVVNEKVVVDTAAGYYFVLDGNRQAGAVSGLSILSYRISDNALVASVLVGNAANLEEVHGLAIDPATQTLYVSEWGLDPSVSGIEKIAYDPSTGFFVSRAGASTLGTINAATHAVSSAIGIGSGTITPVFAVYEPANADGLHANPAGVNNIDSISLDLAHHLVYFAANSLGYDVAPFGTAANGIFVADLNNPGSTPVELTSTVQFPAGTNNFGSGSPTPTTANTSGAVGQVAVDVADGLVFFTTSEYDTAAGTIPSQDALWYVTTGGGAGQTAVKLTGAGFSDFFPTIYGGLTFDADTRTLYITDNNRTGTLGGGAGDSTSKVYALSLAIDGKSITAVRTLADATLTNNVHPDAGNTIDGLTFVNIPKITLSGGGTATEGGAGVSVASATTTDQGGGYYVGARVQITGGTFASNENSTADDHLGATTTGTSIIAAYNSATETLTLSGYDTIAHYNQVLASVTFNATGFNPTNYGGNATRTVTWSVDDGTPIATTGVGITQNFGATTLNITAVNNAPVETGTTAAPSYSPGGAAATVDSAIAISDVDNLNLAGATVAISSGFASGDLLNFINQSGISGSYVAATGLLTLTGSATVAQYQTALRSVTYSSTSGNPTAFGVNRTRTVSFVANDGSAANNLSSGLAQIVNVSAASITDTAANVAANIGTIHANAAFITSITLSDPNKRVVVTAAQRTADAADLAKINNLHFLRVNNADGTIDIVNFAPGGGYSSEDSHYDAAKNILTESYFDSTANKDLVLRYDHLAAGKLEIEGFKVTGQPYDHYQNFYDAANLLTAQNLFNAANVLIHSTTISAASTVNSAFDATGAALATNIDFADGTSEVDTYQISGQPFTAIKAHFNAAHNLVQAQYDLTDGSHQITSFAALQTLIGTAGNDLFSGFQAAGGSGQTFAEHETGGVFGTDTIANFNTGAGHDTLTFDIATFGNNVATFLSGHAAQSGAEVTITDGASVLTVKNVTLASLTPDVSLV